MKSSNESLSQLLAKMRKGHPTLKEIYGSPNQGVEIAMIDAFVVDSEKFEALINEDPNSERILKPFVDGAKLKRWSVDTLESWLICTPKGKVNIDDYPAVKRHLLAFRPQLEKRDSNQAWFELDEALASFVDQMEKPKISFAGKADRPSFFMDPEGGFLSHDSFFAGQADFYLAGLLNSETYWKLLKGAEARTGGDWHDVGLQEVAMLPIPDADGFQRGGIGRSADFCQRAIKERNDLVKHFQGMTAYNLSPEGLNAKLSDRLRNWFFLDFASFRDEIIKTFGQDIPADDLELWENYLEQEKQKVIKLNADIAHAERQIEEAVYAIFGLTKDEIKLIEQA